MKICMVSLDFLPYTGGIAAHVYGLSKALVDQGNKVYIITSKSNLKGKGEELNGIKVYRVFCPHLGLIGTIVYLFLAWFKLQSLLKKEKIDILHCHTVTDALIAKYTKGVPRVQTEHTSHFLETVKKGNFKSYKRLNYANHIIGPSEEIVSAIVTKLEVDPNKVSFIPNGVDTKRFNPKVKGDRIRKKYSINPHEKVVLCPRRLWPKNGVRYLIESMPHVIKKFNDIKCLIVGSGPEKNKLVEKARELKIFSKIIFTGEVFNVEMPNYYAASDIVVLPSLIEATSIAGLEAMACGKPLVGTKVGGIPYLVKEGKTGKLVPPKDSENLARGIISLLSDHRKREIMGKNGRKKVEKEFSWKIIAKKTLDIYEKCRIPACA